MNKSTIHPDETLLTAYSAGSLPLSQALCISAHVEHCPTCQQEIKHLNDLGSELMQQLKPSPGSTDLKAQLLARLDSLDETHEAPTRIDKTISRCLHQFIKNGYQNLAWKRVSPDIHSVELCRDSNGAKVELLRIKPGGAATTHTHLGDEYTVILEGSFSDESGLYQKGDFLLRDASHQHRPVATQDGECICLAVTEGPIQFTGLFSRLLNPLIRRSYA
ncbi:MAG: ChrR family anti-sigma-E factor [Gammaproteobacteria bacterium]|nr:ChrR family anti-sigma-E factor [Gammaproteobacteria bacterium]